MSEFLENYLRTVYFSPFGSHVTFDSVNKILFPGFEMHIYLTYTFVSRLEALLHIHRFNSKILTYGWCENLCF